MTTRISLSLAISILGIAALLLGACAKPATATTTPSTPARVGGPCTYTDIPGTAKIVSVKPAPADGYNCGKNAEVTFDFSPSDPAAASSYRIPNMKDTGRHYTVGGGMNPPKAWVDEQGLTEGSQQSCIRSEETAGTCTPVIFSFPKISKTGWEKYCAEK